MTDIGAELYEAIKAEFDKAIAQDRYIQALTGRIEAGTVSPKDIALYAQQLGFRLRRAIEHNVSADRLPNGQMYYNIAEKILRPSLQTNYDLFNAVAAEIQAAVDKKQGIRIAAQQAELPKERIDTVIGAASEPGISEETMLRRMSVPAETIIRSYADDYAKANADFRSRAGIDEYIVRRDDGSCCEWCANLVGKYRYPDEVPHDVWRRHDNCGCFVEHVSGTGRRVNVHTKKAGTDEEQREWLRQLDERKKAKREKIRQTAGNAKKRRVLSKEEGNRIEAEQLAKRKGRLTGEAESGIIQSKGLTKLTNDHSVVNPMDSERYYAMKSKLESRGCSVVSAKAGSDDERFLLASGAEAISDEIGIIHLGEKPSASAFFEEIIHYSQMKKYGVLDQTDFIERAAREVAANRKLLRNGKAYGFTQEDFEDIETNLKKWELDFEKRVGVSYDESDLKREI